jgi:hypothetical protein
MGGIERGRRRLRICRTEDVHLRSAAQGKDANNRMWTIPKENTGAERVVNIARLFRGHSTVSMPLRNAIYPSTDKRLTSTSSNTVSTKRSSSELRHPTITPGDEDRGRSYGQNTRKSLSLMSILSSFAGPLERASAAQLFSRGDTEMYVARVLIKQWMH